MKRMLISKAGEPVQGKEMWHLICHLTCHSKAATYLCYRIFEFWAGSSSEAEAEALKRLKRLASSFKSAEFTIIMLRDGYYCDTSRCRRRYMNSCGAFPKFRKFEEILKVKTPSEVFKERM